MGVGYQKKKKGAAGRCMAEDLTTRGPWHAAGWFWHHAGMKRLLIALFVPAALAAPAAHDGKAREFTHTLKPGGVAEECLRLEAGRSRAFEWRSDSPVDFNIHYHQGDKVTYPVKANKQREGKGRFTAAAGEDYCWMWSTKFPARITGRLGPDE